MNRHSTHAFASWQELEVPAETGPDPLSVRAQIIPAHSCFPVHVHSWGQLVYAVDGVLNVAVEGRCFVVPPDQAVWVPSSVLHSVGSLHGAQYHSLYLVDRPGDLPLSGVAVLGVSPLLRELIIEAAVIANIVMLAAGRLLRDRMEQGALTKSSDPAKAERRGGGRGFATSAALWGASRLARRSPLGLAVVVGGLAAKVFYDRGKRLEAGRPGRKQARKMPGSES